MAHLRVVTPPHFDPLETQLPVTNGWFRSGVPDLIFQDVREQRVRDIEPWLDTPEGIDARASLHRVTVFATYRCGLACPYCRSRVRDAADLERQPHRGLAFDRDSFARFLDSLDSPVEHLHFTGGEATLVRDLAHMVKAAKDRGVSHISVTSNGVSPAVPYEALIEAGLSEVRISLDAREPVQGAALTGRTGAWTAAVDTIRRLAALRRSGAAFFLIVNTVITMENRRDMADIVRFVMALGVDDLKLIASVDDTPVLGAFEEQVEAVTKVEEHLRTLPREAFPLLRLKLRTVFSQRAVGLADTRPDRPDDWRCYIPLTERTVDRVFYYPCSVYLRESGAPLGRIDEPPDEQRAKTVAFVRDGRCLDDPICRRYCLHCTREFNESANAARTTNHTAAATPA
ncbi:MAG: radical SAM protein [Vicinamibacterales bacterium]